MVHLIALITMLAVSGGVATQTAYAAKSHTSKPASTSHAHSGAKVDINAASEKDLEELPGIGTVMAQKIIAGRPYKSVQDLKHAGIPASTIKGITGKAKAGRTAAAKSGEAHASAMSADRSEALAAKSSAEPKKAPRSFFGIPIGGSSKPAPKEEPAPAAKEAEHRQASGSAMTESEPAKRAPAKGMVWANLDTKTYYHEGSPSYGATRHGKFMWEDQAIRDGCRAAKAASKR